jgi:cystathionine beta-lyase
VGFDFDEIIDRKNTNSIKYDFYGSMGKVGYNCIPMWIADMDFRTPPCVRDALIARANHGIFGYSSVGDHYYVALSNWLLNRHGWSIKPEWLTQTEGVIPAVSVALAAYTQPNDSVLLHYPSYNLFNMMIDKNRRNLIKSPLVFENNRYTIDFKDFERQIVRSNVKLFILCNPHNPIGRVWTEEELITMGDICLKHGVLVISDEIHQDFVYKPHKHLVFANLKPEYEPITITCTAPTKTFNISGVPISNILIIDDDLREKFMDEQLRRGNMGGGILEILACQTAYAQGAEWLDALIDYLTQNVNFARAFLQERLPEISLVEPEGTYFLWLDCRRLGVWQKELETYIADEAQILLNGAPGAEGFIRLNIACPKATLEKAFGQLEKAIRKLIH